jgi:hypothetical protein
MARASLGAVGLASGVAYVNLPHQMKEPVRRALRLPSDDHPSVPLDPFGLRPVEAPLDPSTPIPPPVPVGSHRSVAPVGSPGAEAVRGSAIKRRTSKVASRAGSPGPVVSAHDLSLGEESALLEQARADLLRGSGVRALQALATHERRFPEGRMSEQREALTIQALAQTGRRDEAYWRAKRFRERFPGSLMLEVIRSALEGEEP